MFFIITGVVPFDISLLQNKESMKKAKVSIDFQKDKIFMFDRQVDLCSSSTGHFCEDIKNENVDLLSIKSNVICFLKVWNLRQ